jgi:hypothetical protein
MISDLDVYITSWGNAFKECDRIDGYVSTAIVALTPILSKLGKDAAALEAYSNPKAKWQFSELS